MYKSTPSFNAWASAALLLGVAVLAVGKALVGLVALVSLGAVDDDAVVLLSFALTGVFDVWDLGAVSQPITDMQANATIQIFTILLMPMFFIEG
ncbi:hypothetical protein [Undibacterium sp. Ren11W]|uniref:hypothetical protein n=1 Tax=Undibacterium sp. Ren11W TaxID=3413045 RepID=UPI003BF35941